WSSRQSPGVKARQRIKRLDARAQYPPGPDRHFRREVIELVELLQQLIDDEPHRHIGGDEPKIGIGAELSYRVAEMREIAASRFALMGQGALPPYILQEQRDPARHQQ